MPYNKTVF